MIIHTLRLSPGEDLRLAIEAACDQLMAEKDCQAACVISSVGGLSCAVLRYAAEPEGSRLEGPLEMITLSGTLAAPGSGGVHLHASVADAQGRVTGGHLMPGCVVRTTAEIVLALLPGWSFVRTLDPATGFRELVAGRRP
ncbi:MAG: DNA-binding protein [Polaromonas sp.]|nr:DNA-binding protein [Polaromonas sp.]